MSDDNHSADPSERPRRRGRRGATAGTHPLTFAANLKRLRQRDGLTQPQLEDALGLPIGTIARWEGRTHEPTLNQLVQIAAHFGVPPGELLNADAVFGTNLSDTQSEVWRRFVLDLLAQYPSSRIEINFWAGNQTANIVPDVLREPPSV